MSPHWICWWYPSHSTRNAFGCTDGRNVTDVKGCRHLVLITGLLVNPGKPDVVVFTRRYKWSVTRTLELERQGLGISKSATYLGVILDNKLTWKDHFDSKCNKFITTLWLCKRAIGSNWGLKPDTLLRIFTAILRPRLTYTSIDWWSRVKQKTAMARFERLRGLIIRVITGASKSSPTTALGALMGLDPLHLTITAEAGKAAWRIGENSNTVISKKLRNTANIATRPIMKMVWDRTSPRYLFDKNYKVSLLTKEDWEVGCAHLPGDGDNWFVDGFKNREGAGTGVYGKNSDTSFVVPLGPYPTVL